MERWADKNRLTNLAVFYIDVVIIRVLTNRYSYEDNIKTLHFFLDVTV